MEIGRVLADVDELIRRRELRRAEQVLRELLAVEPRHVEAGCRFGRVAQDQGRGEEAIARYRAVLEVDPDHAVSLLRLGRLLRRVGRLDEASNTLEHACRVHPNRPEPHNALGITYIAAKRLDDARVAFARAVELQPDHADATTNLGNTLHELGRDREALEVHLRAVECRPGSATLHNNLGVAYMAQRLLDGASRHFAIALSLDPTYAEARRNMAVCEKLRGNMAADVSLWHECLTAFHTSLAIEPEQPDVESNLLFCMQYVPWVTDRQLFDAHVKYGKHYAPLARPSEPVDRDPGRRLRIGYVSAHLSRHPVGYFLKPVLEHHDPKQVEVFCYHDRPDENEFSRSLKKRAHHWKIVEQLSDEQLDAVIREDRIDILIDLAGHTPNRLLVFARKPAPVQATWAGYVGTTGLVTMDWLIADGRHVPEGTDHLYVERVWRMPDGYVCYTPPRYAADVGPLPARKNGWVTFGCYNKLPKVNPDVVATWVRILERVPRSRLVLKAIPFRSEETVARFRAEFTDRGLSPERVDLVPDSPHKELFEAYNAIDIALDPFPYSGGLTTLEGLWMGVPTITFPGDRFASRHATSHLTNVGLKELVARDRDDYVERAVALATDLDRLEAIRAGLRRQMAGSPAIDGARFTRNLEDAFRAMWRDAVT